MSAAAQMALEALKELRYVVPHFWDDDNSLIGELDDACRKADASISALESELAQPVGPVAVPPEPEKRAPVQGFVGGIPWYLHLEAYEAYSKKWSPQPALIDLEGRGCRGGFGTSELDEFIPGWRDRISEVGKLKSEIEKLKALLAAPEPVNAELLEALKSCVDYGSMTGANWVSEKARAAIAKAGGAA